MTTRLAREPLRRPGICNDYEGRKPMLKRTPTIYIYPMYLLATASGLFGDTSCAKLEGAKPETQLAYLQRDRKELDVNCILFAIVHLGTARYAPASKTLVKYLDYIVPEDPNPVLGFLRPRDIFPVGPIPGVNSTIHNWRSNRARPYRDDHRCGDLRLDSIECHSRHSRNLQRASSQVRCSAGPRCQRVIQVRSRRRRSALGGCEKMAGMCLIGTVPSATLP